MNVPGELARAVHELAQGRCQYCLMHQSLQGATFHLEHITPRSRGGRTILENLTLACPACNLRKADRVVARDPETRQLVPLFRPGEQDWADHFGFIGFRIEGRTPVGRATVAALDLNHPRRLRIRAAEEKFGLYPPAS